MSTSFGPVPKRDDQRIRRNKPETETEHVYVEDDVEPPELRDYITAPHRIVSLTWDSILDSAQSRYYEPSDWAYALFLLEMMDNQIKSGRPSPGIIHEINSGLQSLMITEGERRRLKLEVHRGKQEDPDEADPAAMILQRLTQPSMKN